MQHFIHHRCGAFCKIALIRESQKVNYFIAGIGVYFPLFTDVLLIYSENGLDETTYMPLESVSNNLWLILFFIFILNI